MYKQILVAFDGSEPAEQALTKAIDLAKHYDASLLIGHVIDTRNFPQAASAYPQTLWSEMKEDAEQMLARCREKADASGLENVQTVIQSGNPRVEMPKKLTSDYSVDLLIVGESGRNTVERMVIGSVTEACMRRAPCDVLTVKNEMNATLHQDILVAVDGSAQSEQALEKAIQLARTHHSTLTITHVVEWGTFAKDIAFYQQSYEAEVRDKARQMLETYKLQAEDAGVQNVQTVLRAGNPRTEIPRVLPVEYDIDLLITAETGQNAVEKIFTGSVAEASVRRATCDVFTIKK
ncbi:universal stress protein [Natribacillus halophilus]|uniref:Nucleotide-binding universal stress protein, UspA family n=1 Tax=Natribacillus halophilus TaxID=549003 RepID=A0A1G8SD46_9BACI|nr:universal stress protein [Natribacillus halophilus]SDJ26665.1 Nucleotide-binding universal stress protein, UspA family [Natribacillus halophilus]